MQLPSSFQNTVTTRMYLEVLVTPRFGPGLPETPRRVGLCEALGLRSKEAGAQSQREQLRETHSPHLQRGWSDVTCKGLSNFENLFIHRKCAFLCKCIHVIGVFLFKFDIKCLTDCGGRLMTSE